MGKARKSKQGAGSRTIEQGVVLPEGQSGSRLFHGVLREAAERFPETFGPARFPQRADGFKDGYGDALVRFEAARAGSPRRDEVARFLAQRTQDQLSFRSNGTSEPLAAHLAAEATRDIQLARRPVGGRPGLRAEVPFDGRVHRGREVLTLLDQLQERRLMTARAADGVRWTVERIEADGGALDLSGQRFAVLGASAELAPTAMLLEAGATVLWVDVAEPERLLNGHRGERPLAGALVTAPGARDLLQAPGAIAAAVRRFAEEGDDGRVHLGLFAYAPGAARELRLSAAMDAIARALGPDVVRSVALYISPTVPSCVQPEDRGAVEAQLKRLPLWKGVLGRLGALPGPGHHVVGDVAIARAIVTLQGTTYQAAQYLTKIAAAEAWATADRPVTVSANVAGITNTRSLAHPLFQAGFVGAPSFGVQIFQPATTRALNGLLMLHDVLNPDAPGAAAARHPSPAAKARAVLAQQIHGGVYALPWTLEGTVRAGAVLGLCRQPSVLWSRPRR